MLPKQILFEVRIGRDIPKWWGFKERNAIQITRQILEPDSPSPSYTRISWRAFTITIFWSLGWN